MKTAVILGANGRFGQAATQAFAGAGWRVLAQVRRAPVASLATLPARVTAVHVPLSDTEALARAAQGAAADPVVVVHAINPPYDRWENDALPALEHALALAQRLGACLMLPGNVYNFGEGMPAVLRENTPQQPTTRYGRLRCVLENTLRERAARNAGGGMRSVVIRAGDFFGCGSGSWLDQAIAKDMARGKLVYPGPLQVPHAWAYLPDLAQAFVAVAEAPPAAPWQVFHFAGHTLTGQQLLDVLDHCGAALGLRPAQGFRVGGLPWPLIRAVGVVHAPWRALAALRYLWRVPHALDGSRLAAQVRLPPAHTPHAAFLQALRDGGVQASVSTINPA